MSEDQRNGSGIADAAEERLLRRLLEAGEAPPDLDGPDRRTARETVETLGLLPWGLEPVTPRPEVKAALMRRLEAEGAAAPPPARPPADRRTARWMLPMAAALAVALLGVTAWQGSRLVEQRRTIERLSARLAAAGAGEETVAEIRGRVEELSDRLAMLTSPGAEFCVLKPVAGASRLADARATMVFSADRGRWYLNAEGLEPCARGRVYQLWIHTEEDAVRAATFDAEPAAGRLELHGTADEEMEIRAVSITIESDPDPPAPSEPVLYADEAMRLL